MGKTYACSDLHGMLAFYQSIKEYISPEDTVYFLGDAGDRGPQPWECIKTILNDHQFIYIKGNHEDLLVQALGNGYGSDYALLYMNGGEKTYEECMNESDWKQWRKSLDELPTKLEYVNTRGERIILSHAGFTPCLRKDGTEGFVWDEDLIWDRKHFHDEWPEDECFEKTFIVHGHTPIPYLEEIFYWDIIFEDENEDEHYPFIYADGHKIDIDAGCVFQKKCILLDLDTFDSILFTA